MEWGLIFLMTQALYMDWTKRKIPNNLIAFGLVLFLVTVMPYLPIGVLLARILISALVFLAGWIFFQTGIIGAGDLKLFMLLSLFFSGERFVIIVFYVFSLTAVWGLIYFLVTGTLMWRIEYFFFYLIHLYQSGTMILYGSELPEITQTDLKNNEYCLKSAPKQIAMAIPLFVVVLLELGGVLG